MNEGDRVVRHALERAGAGGGEFHDVSSSYELLVGDARDNRMGFVIPEDRRRD